MKIYISGPITGTADYKERFEKAAQKITANGHEAVNPVKLHDILDPATTTWAQFMSAATGLLYACDAALFLPGWQLSKGAMKERHAARNGGLLIFDDPEDLPRSI